ncbi:hypothetical protein Ahy_A10g049527 [Arachis hypogaea]|uniref:Aminotransferase-like plant mobile domain-containing protein n=1 Tax=Arachis hypogaea TaxID=3818 RepID=A0A445B7D1_ARAHY|nr:hypothetical protein Ahy_A10g049527 [Arachis hypogaea]
MGVVPGAEDKQSQTKWTVKLTWFLNTVCGELEKDATEERLLRWLPLLEDLDACGRLSWGSVVLAWMYPQICRAIEHGVRNLGGCISLLLSCAYHRISLLCPDGFDTHRFPLVERWVQHRSDNDRGEGRLRHYRRVLNGIGMLAIGHRYLCIPSSIYAHTELFGQGDQHLVPVGVVPEDLPLYHPPAPELHQPEDGHLPELRLLVGRGRGRGRGRARGRGRRGGGGGREQGDELHWDRDPVNPPGSGPKGVGGHTCPSNPLGHITLTPVLATRLKFQRLGLASISSGQCMGMSYPVPSTIQP